MRYREKLNIIFMRDNGPRHSVKLRRSNFILLACFFGFMPFAALLLLIQCYLLWNENIAIRTAMDKLETEFQIAETRAEKLENLESLLKEENIRDKEIILRQLAAQPEPQDEHVQSDEINEGNKPADGPGHEEFPAFDNGRVKVANVQVRALHDNSLRIGFDLRNPDNEPILSGEVSAILLTANGERKPLTFSQEEIGSFRISRFKHTVMLAPVPKGVNLTDAQVILEVKDQNEKPLYRNVYAVQR